MGNTRWLGLLFLAVLAGTAGCLSRQYNEPEGGAESQYTQGRAPYVPGNSCGFAATDTGQMLCKYYSELRNYNKAKSEMETWFNESESCTAFMSTALYTAATDRANASGPAYVVRNTATLRLVEQLERLGWTRNDNCSQAMPGDVVFTIQYRDSRGEGTPYYNFPGHTYMLLGWIDPVGFNPRRARVVDNQGWNHFRRVITNQEDHQWPCWYFMRAPRG